MDKNDSERLVRGLTGLVEQSRHQNRILAEHTSALRESLEIQRRTAAVAIRSHEAVIDRESEDRRQLGVMLRRVWDVLNDESTTDELKVASARFLLLSFDRYGKVEDPTQEDIKIGGTCSEE